MTRSPRVLAKTRSPAVRAWTSWRAAPEPTFSSSQNREIQALALVTASIITDFLSETDRINFTGIDANTDMAGDQAFSMIGINAFSGAAGL